MKLIKSSILQFVPASHEDPSNPGVLKKVLLQKNDFFDGKPQMINWALLPKKSAFQAHYHEDMQEIFIMLGGPVIAEIDKEVITLDKGDTLVIDPMEVHLMRNSNDFDVEYIVVGIAGNKQGKTVTLNTA